MYVAMDNSTLVSILSIVPATLLALAALITSLRNSAKLTEVHLSLNSRLSQLIEASKALGAIEQRTYTDVQDKAAEDLKLKK
jgi:hypothetical protein